MGGKAGPNRVQTKQLMTRREFMDQTSGQNFLKERATTTTI